jgi:CHAD domain-containing protein
MLSLFRPYLPGPVKRLRSRVRRLGRALGEVRDIDVQLADLLATGTHWKEEDRARLEPLRAALHESRNRARRRMLRWLDSPSAERLRVNLARLVEWPKERPSRASQAPTAVVAPELVRKRYRRFLQAADKIGPDSPAAEYHAVRIQAKRTRYALAAFAPLYGEPARALMRAMAKLQDLLGEQQDAITAAERLVSLAHRRRRSLPRTTVFLMGRIAERAERISVRSRQRYQDAYDKTRGRRWKVLKRAMTTTEDSQLEEARNETAPAPVAESTSKTVDQLRVHVPRPRLRAVARKG